jgi:hypothetical protein
MIMQPPPPLSCPYVEVIEWPFSAKQEVTRAGGRESTASLERFVNSAYFIDN